MKTTKSYLIFPLFLLLSITLISVQGCKEKEEPQDPCKDQQATSAAFNIGFTYTYNDQYYEMDTFYFGPYITFSVKDQSVDSCWWKVGLDPRIITDKSFTWSFDADLGEIPVTLVVKKQPNTACFPQDNGLDTVTRSFWILPMIQHPMVGEYEGTSSHDPNTVFTVKIDTTSGYNGKPFSLGIFNLPNDCPNKYHLNRALPEQVLEYGRVTGSLPLDCNINQFKAHLLENRNKLTIDFSVIMKDSMRQNTEEGEVFRQFVGYRK